MDPVFVYISKVQSAGGTAIYQTSMPKIWSKMKKNINIFRQILILPENPNLGIWSVTTHYIGSRKKACFFKAIWSGSLLRKNLVSVFSTKIWKKKSLWNFQNPKPPMIRHYNYYTWIGNDLYKWVLLIFILLASSRMRTFLPSMTSFLCWWNRTRFFAPMMVMWLFLVVIMIIRWSN